MAEKKSRPTATLDSLALLISRTAASADTKFAALAGDIADLKTEMIARFKHVDTQFRGVNERLRHISSEIAVIHRRIERLEEQGASNAGFAKEIDHLLARVAEIERHLGLHKSDKEIAA